MHVSVELGHRHSLSYGEVLVKEKVTETKYSEGDSFNVQFENNSFALKLKRDVNARQNQCVVDLTQSPELWGNNIRRERQRHQKAISDKLISESQPFQIVRVIPISSSGEAKVHLSRHHDLVINFGEKIQL